MIRDFNRRILDSQLIFCECVLCTYYLHAHRATATGTMNNLWRPKLSLTPPAIVRSIQDRLLTPRSIELSPPPAKSKWWKRGISFDTIKKWREWQGRGRKKDRLTWLKNDEKEKDVRGEKGKRRRKRKEYIYVYKIEVLRLPGYIDVTFLRRPRSLFFFFFIRHPISREQRDECASILRRNSLRRRGAESILGGRSLIRCWSYWT